MAATIRDVAKQARVSVSTVSRIMNGTARVDPEKEIAVRQAIDLLQYEPNQFGRGLAKQKTEMIGVYFQSNGPILQSSYDLELIRGAAEALRRRNNSLVMLTENPDGMDRKPVFYRYVREKRIDGLLLSGLSAQIRQDPFFSQLIESGYPVSYIGKRFHKKGMQVYAQFEQYHLEMLRLLRENGHRRVILYYVPFHREDVETIVERAHTLFPELTLFPEETGQERGKQLEKLEKLLNLEKCTAACCPAIGDAKQAINLCAQMGISVPDQLSLIAAEHRRGEGESCYPAICAMYVPARQMGSFAAEQLLDAIAGKAEVVRSREFSVEYIPRDSIRTLENAPENMKSQEGF